jgi:hypothetical protein
MLTMSVDYDSYRFLSDDNKEDKSVMEELEKLSGLYLQTSFTGDNNTIPVFLDINSPRSAEFINIYNFTDKKTSLSWHKECFDKRILKNGIEIPEITPNSICIAKSNTQLFNKTTNNDINIYKRKGLTFNLQATLHKIEHVNTKAIEELKKCVRNNGFHIAINPENKNIAFQLHRIIFNINDEKKEHNITYEESNSEKEVKKDLAYKINKALKNTDFVHKVSTPKIECNYTVYNLWACFLGSSILSYSTLKCFFKVQRQRYNKDQEQKEVQAEEDDLPTNPTSVEDLCGNVNNLTVSEEVPACASITIINQSNDTMVAKESDCIAITDSPATQNKNKQL